MSQTPPMLALVGPTASGKTDLSIALARALGAEIVGCDSMQVYRRMAVLSQQPTAEQRRAVAHHLIDCVEPSERFNAGCYRRLALEAVEAIRRRGRPVLLVGGTGLYLRALLDGLCEAPPGDPGVRTAILDAIRQEGAARMHQRLQAVDRAGSLKIHPNNTQRLVRALEVYEVTGRPLSSFWAREAGLDGPIAVIGLTRGREALYGRINRRVERMLREEGVLDEVRGLAGVTLSQTAAQVHGLRFLRAHLDGLSLEETIRQWQQQVRQYARRQLIWFRAERRLRWVELAEDESEARALERILAAAAPAPAG